MAITNGYCTAEALIDVLGFAVGDTGDEAAIDYAIESASRQIDAHCGFGRKFWQDTSTVDRKYFPRHRRRLVVDDISTLTGLAVKIDENDDGTFEKTLTINTDFQVEPVNAAAEFPVQPWTSLWVLDGYLGAWSGLSSGRPFVQVTAKFGWPAVPDAVERACVMQAKNIFKAPDLFFGSFQLAEDGAPLRVPSMDPVARALLEPFIRYDEVDGYV